MKQQQTTRCQCSATCADLDCPIGQYYFASLNGLYAFFSAPGFLYLSAATKEAIQYDYTTQQEQYRHHVRRAQQRHPLQTTLDHLLRLKQDERSHHEHHRHPGTHADQRQ